MDNNNSFESIFESHKNRVFGFAYRMLQDKETATDITQEVFLRLLRTQGENKDLYNPTGWLFKTARNLCLNQIKKIGRETPLNGDCEIEAGTNEPNIELQITLKRAVGTLESPMREALLLKTYEQLSYEQIAEILGTTKPAVRSLIYRARLSLKEKFDLKNNKR